MAAGEVKVECWGPSVQGDKDLLENETINLKWIIHSPGFYYSVLMN